MLVRNLSPFFTVSPFSGLIFPSFFCPPVGVESVFETANPTLLFRTPFWIHLLSPFSYKSYPVFHIIPTPVFHIIPTPVFHIIPTPFFIQFLPLFSIQFLPPFFIPFLPPVFHTIPTPIFSCPRFSSSPNFPPKKGSFLPPPRFSQQCPEIARP